MLIRVFFLTKPDAGFFTVFSFLKGGVKTDDAFIESLVSDYGMVVIPMYDFYPQDAKQRDAQAGLNQLRLSFCFSESTGGRASPGLTRCRQGVYRCGPKCRWSGWR